MAKTFSNVPSSSDSLGSLSYDISSHGHSSGYFRSLFIKVRSLDGSKTEQKSSDVLPRLSSAKNHSNRAIFVKIINLRHLNTK